MRIMLHRILAAAMAAIIALSVCFCAFAQNGNDDITPTVYVEGQGSTLFKDKDDSKSASIYPLTIPDGYIQDFIKELNPIFAKAYITGDYEEYCDAICEAADPIFKEIRFNSNGEPADNSGVKWKWTLNGLRDTCKDGKYGLYDYTFVYDWRVDPLATADVLNRYINDVLTVTGAEQVNLVGRCMGSNIATAYIYKYGSEKVNKYVLYCSTLKGTAECAKTFSGKIVVDPNGAERYVYDYMDSYISDDLISELIKSAVTLLNATNGLDLGIDFITDVYNKVKPNIVPRLLIQTYATFPTYWSMVGEEDYNDAKEMVFSGKEAEYAGLIEKIDYYHYNVLCKAEDILTRASARGMEVAVVCKYGYQMVPVVSNYTDVADGVVELSLSSLGATTTSVNKKFNRKYLCLADERGLTKYISPDRQVDASSCAFPDSTWIIKGIEHRVFPASLDNLIITFLNHNGQMTVEDYEQYPQYLVFDEETKTLSPMNEENADDTNWNRFGIFGGLFKLFKTIYLLIMRNISNNT